MKALAFLVLDTAGRIVDSGSPADAPLLEDKVAKWNAAPLGALFHRLVPVAEIPAWQPIETAPREGWFVVGREGESGFATRSAFLHPKWTHWQPLPAPPREDA